jgi:hypothetical protein
MLKIVTKIVQKLDKIKERRMIKRKQRERLEAERAYILSGLEQFNNSSNHVIDGYLTRGFSNRGN